VKVACCKWLVAGCLRLERKPNTVSCKIRRGGRKARPYIDFLMRPLPVGREPLPVQILHNRLNLAFTVQSSLSHDHVGLAATQEVTFLEGVE
jgi:hypothetical protein